MNITTVPLAPRADSSVWRLPSGPASSTAVARAPSSTAGVLRLTMAVSPRHRGGKSVSESYHRPELDQHPTPMFVDRHTDPDAFFAAAAPALAGCATATAAFSAWVGAL